MAHRHIGWIAVCFAISNAGYAHAAKAQGSDPPSSTGVQILSRGQPEPTPDLELLQTLSLGESMPAPDRALAQERARTTPRARRVVQLLFQQHHHEWRRAAARLGLAYGRDRDDIERHSQELQVVEQRGARRIRPALERLREHLEEFTSPLSQEQAQSALLLGQGAARFEQWSIVRSALEVLTAQCANCPATARLQITVADHYFQEQAFPSASALYQAAADVSRAEPRFRGYAQYKLGWCAIIEFDFSGALMHFRAAATLSSGVLRREAARDAMIPLARLAATGALAAAEQVEEVRTLGAFVEEPNALAQEFSERLEEVSSPSALELFRAVWRDASRRSN